MGTEDVNEKLSEEYEESTVDLSGQKLKKLERPTSKEQSAVALIVDDNELQKLDNMDSYSSLKRLSAANNQIFRMYWVCNLTNLEELSLSNNSISTIEGLKDLKFLKILNLAKNKIKAIDNLNNKVFLEKLDLSENNITHISDLSSLQNLKALYLHRNKITHLKQCDKNLPISIVTLTLSNNLIEDLNEISHLVNLLYLKEFSIARNPCVESGESQKFSFRPFIKNWCPSIEVMDNVNLNDIECLKAEWLYSQGKGRSFKLGEHAALVEYLQGVCPKEVEEDMENEDVKKLKLILSKAQQHQKQLREQLTTGHLPVGVPSKPALCKIKSTLLPERMVSSFCEHPHKDQKNSQELMSRSLDMGIFRTSPLRSHHSDVRQKPLETSTTFIPVPDPLVSPDVGPATLRHPSSASGRTSRSSSRNSYSSLTDNKKRTPTKHTIKQRNNSSSLSSHKLANCNSRTSIPRGSVRSRNTPSPGAKVTVIRQPATYFKETSDDEGSEVSTLHAVTGQRTLDQRKQKLEKAESKKKNALKFEDTRGGTNCAEWKAATCIQRRWRGYKTRNLDKNVLAAFNSIQMTRMQEHVTKVMADMEATRDTVEKNRKLLLFHMQAIHGLWKKMSAQQSGGKRNETGSLQGLAEICDNLNKQMESLQMLVKTMLTSKASLSPIATQTEIVAVRVPNDDRKEIFFADKKQSEGLESYSSSSEGDLMKNKKNENTFVCGIKAERPSASEQFADGFLCANLNESNCELAEGTLSLFASNQELQTP